MKTKIFDLKKNNLKLKIEICDSYIITSWLHFNNKDFTNNRRFPVEQLMFSFNTLKPVCNVEELYNIENFMFKKLEGTQLDLF
jgi:hypothetical protein